jgi:hemerythrin-like domain-containing protein
MKRHESLVPLSREHQEALLLSLLLQKGAPAYKNLPSGLPEKSAFALNMFNNVLRKHFQKEEDMLEKVKHVHITIEKLAAEIREEHVSLTKAFLALDTSEPTIDSLDELGAALEAHIRKEERVLFESMQQYCSEELLGTLHLG